MTRIYGPSNFSSPRPRDEKSIEKLKDKAMDNEQDKPRFSTFAPSVLKKEKGPETTVVSTFSKPTQKEQAKPIVPTGKGFVSGVSKPLVKDNSLTDKKVPQAFVPSSFAQKEKEKSYVPSSLGGHTGNGVNSGYVDKHIDSFGKFGINEYGEIKRLVNSFDFTNIKSILNFGEDIQKHYSDISGRMLALTRDGRVDIDKHLNDIVKIVMSFGHDDLVGNVGIMKTLSWMVSSVSLKDRLQLALNGVDLSVHYVETTLPILMEHIDNLEKIEKEFKILDSKLNLHIVALKIVSQYLKETTTNTIDGSDKTKYIGSRIDSLLQSSITGQMTPQQISLMRNTFVEKTESARNTVLGMVSIWKSHCSTALALIENGGEKNLGGIAGDILAARDKLVSAIDKI